MERHKLKKSSKIKLYYTPFEIRSKYEKMIKNGYRTDTAKNTLAELNAVNTDTISLIIEREIQKEKELGWQAYQDANRSFDTNREQVITYEI